MGKGLLRLFFALWLVWLNLAAANGDNDAIKGRDLVAKLMSQQQIAQAQQMASACQASNYKNCD
jgi:hypothetical protein